MSDGDALIRAICETPEDDLRRLVYADWLEEQGKANKAATIRKGVSQPGKKNEGRWRRDDSPKNKATHKFWTNRGFRYRLECKINWYLHSLLLFRWHPLTEIVITDCMPQDLCRWANNAYVWARPTILDPHLAFGGPVIPIELFEHIGPKVFATAQEARDRLHSACIDYGRHSARLSPLNRDLLRP